MTKFKSVLALALIAFVAVGCGKDKKKNNTDPYALCGQYGAVCNYNSYLNNGALTYDTSAMTYVTQWYQGQDPYIGTSGLIDFKSTSGNSFINFDSWNPDTCYSLQGGGYLVGQYDKSAKKCLNASAYNKANNADLTAAVSGSVNGLTLIDVKMMGNGVYMLSYSPVYGQATSVYGMQPTKMYIIDTKLNTLLNPTRVIDVQSGAQKYLYEYRQQAVTLQ